MQELPPKPSADRFQDLPAAEQDLVKKTARLMCDLVFQYVVPLTICGISRGAPAEINNGSAILVRNSSGVFALTASHVINKFLQRQAAGEQVGARLGRIRISIPRSIHWQDERLDLALLSLAESQATKIGSWVYRLPCRSDAQVLATGSSVLWVGFPGHLREARELPAIEFGAMSGLLRVTETAEDHFSCRFERDELIASVGEVPTRGTDFGGMSGGPVFLVSQLHYPLVGVMTEFINAFGELEVLHVKSVRLLPILEE